MRASIVKGAAFERDVARRLSLWVSYGNDAYVFCRRQGSGGACRDRTGSSGASGDIYSDKPVGDWLTDALSFELKAYRDLDAALWKLFSGEDSEILRFAAQAHAAAKVYRRKWVLVWKANRRPILALTNSTALRQAVSASAVLRIPRGGNSAALTCLSAFSFSALLETNPGRLRSRLVG